MEQQEFKELTTESNRLSKIRNGLRQEAFLIAEKINNPNGVYYHWIIQSAYYSHKQLHRQIETKLRGLNSLCAGFLLEAKSIDEKLQKIGRRRRILINRM